MRFYQLTNSITALILILLTQNAFAGRTITVPLSEGKSALVEFETQESGVVLQRFELQGGSMLTEDDKRLLRNYLEFRNFQTSQESDILNFMLTQMPVGEVINPYVNQNQTEKSFTMICSKYGQRHTGSYTAGKGQVSGEAIVGSKTDRCPGRCGGGCGMFLGRSQYTQECFNHDVCNRTLNSQLGPCEDEFWAASQGFLTAPNCF